MFGARKEIVIGDAQIMLFIKLGCMSGEPLSTGCTEPRD